MDRQKVAKIGEKLAQNYLIKKKYSIIAINTKYREGEIDIIAKKACQLIFVEVKTRTSWNFGYPEQAMDIRKGRRVLAAANRYIYETNYLGKWRIDLIALDLHGKKAALRHYQSVEIGD